MSLEAQQIVMVTPEALKAFAADVVRETLEAVRREPLLGVEPEPEYREGIGAIEELFGVAHSTAQMYKNTFLRPAVQQRGRKIRVNVTLARKLFDEHNDAEAKKIKPERR